MTLCLFIKKVTETRVSRIGNGVHFNDYPYIYSIVNCNDVNHDDNDYLYKVKMQHQLAIMIMTMIMIIHSYQSQSYSSDANHTLRCNRCMTTDHEIINAM